MKYQESNLVEILREDFNFTKLDFERYKRAIDDPIFSGKLIKLIFSIRSNPGRYQSEAHKKNTLLKACKNKLDNASKRNYSSPRSIGDIYKKNF